MQLSQLSQWWANTTTTELIWLAVGFGAQIMFSMRFIIQWIASERARRSIVPETFWYFSFAGGLMLLIYAIYRMDPVFMLGQGMGLVIYSRNIYFVWQHKQSMAEAEAVAVPAPAKLAVATPTPAKLAVATPAPAKLAVATPAPAKLAVATPAPAKLAVATPAPAKLAAE